MFIEVYVYKFESLFDLYLYLIIICIVWEQVEIIRRWKLLNLCFVKCSRGYNHRLPYTNYIFTKNNNFEYNYEYYKKN